MTRLEVLLLLSLPSLDLLVRLRQAPANDTMPPWAPVVPLRRVRRRRRRGSRDGTYGLLGEEV